MVAHELHRQQNLCGQNHGAQPLAPFRVLVKQPNQVLKITYGKGHLQVTVCIIPQRVNIRSTRISTVW